ncbi:hypothetical protein DPMN_124405 [Dreissena polymorpha]|uniref:Uncharacterized protein n=1 Tax=Dreissena polymorpha TaxID=45954 RepID=A0A9D4GS29_DREPO|nr:hypothetical protein DPMN_124299 [Dreissena polymorpha]KAH3822616.1 hypothetical protein DPMN_124405 [Dreissena polymorpha]
MEWLAAEFGRTSGQPHRKHSTKNSPQHSALENYAKYCVTNNASYCDRNYSLPTRLRTCSLEQKKYRKMLSGAQYE